MATELLALESENDRDGVAVDGGAFRGAVLTELLRTNAFSKIYAYEPDPDSFGHLKTIFEDHESIYLANLALGPQTSTADFYRGDFPATNSLLPRPKTSMAPYFPIDAAHHEKRPVSVVTLDEECRRLAINKIGLLKLDLQGGELNALKGATNLLTQGKIGVLICEIVFIAKYHQQPLFHDISAFLENFGYSLYAIDDVKTGDYEENTGSLRRNQWNQADAIFLSPALRMALDTLT